MNYHQNHTAFHRTLLLDQKISMPKLDFFKLKLHLQYVEKKGEKMCVFFCLCL